MKLLKRALKIIFKGWFGEKKTALAIWASFDDQTYKRFHDLILPSVNGTTQIDHILVSIYGVFIIETKNKNGWIFGEEKQANWTQIVFKEKHTFQNPLRQTYRQKKILANFIKINESAIYPVIYFVGKSQFKTPMPSNVLDYGLGRFIKGYQKQILSKEEVNRITEILERHKLSSNLTNSDHLHSLQERHHSKTICPKCGARLVLKISRKGSNSGSQFFGCLNYPRCRFTRNQ